MALYKYLSFEVFTQICFRVSAMNSIYISAVVRAVDYKWAFHVCSAAVCISTLLRHGRINQDWKLKVNGCKPLPWLSHQLARSSIVICSSGSSSFSIESHSTFAHPSPVVRRITNGWTHCSYDLKDKAQIRDLSTAVEFYYLSHNNFNGTIWKYA